MYYLNYISCIQYKVFINIFSINCTANDIDNKKISYTCHLLLVVRTSKCRCSLDKSSKLCSIIATQLVLKQNLDSCN